MLSSFLKVFVLSILAVYGIARVHAVSSVEAFSFLGEGNENSAFTIGSSGFTTTPSELVTASGETSHDLTIAGGSNELSFSGSGSAFANYSTLRTASSGTLLNSFFDSTYDPNSNPDGIPQTYFTQSRAEFTQTLQYGGTATNYTSRYLLRLGGTIQGTGRAAVIVELTHAMETPQSWFYEANGSYDLAINSEAYIHGGSPQDFRLSISTLYSFGTAFLDDGSNYSGAANFGNTLEVLGIDLRDENGVLQDQGTITSDSGEMFAIIAVPEPSSFGLLLVAGVVWAARRRRS